MLVILYYCLKVIICSGLLFGYYLLALRNNRFHQWNRYYLLAVVAISFTLPLLKIPLPFFGDDEQPVYESFRVLAAPDLYFSKIQPQKFVFNWPLITAILYGVAVLFFVYLFTRNIFKVLRLKKIYTEENLDGIHFYNTNEPAAPFSFFKNIFWNSNISLGNEKGQQMLRHELTHITEKHSVDKVAMELLIAFAWWNPFLYYIRKELSVIHEFIADQKASAGDAKLQYASLLLMKAMGSTQYALGNPFFHTQLKRRLTMLTTINNPKFSYVRRLLVLPLGVLAIILFSFKYDDDKKLANKQTETTTESLETVGSFNTDDDFNEDTTQKKHAVIKLKKDYKGSPILHVIPTFDLKGVVVKTVDGKTYFLNREESAKELGMTFSDKSWTAPQGAYVTYYDENDVPTDSYMMFEKYEGGQKQMPILPPTFMRTGDSVSLKNPLYIIDGNMVSQSDLKTKWPSVIESINVLQTKEAIKMYGEEASNGAVIITSKTLLADNTMFPDDALYIIDGKAGNEKDFEKLIASPKENINWRVDVIDRTQAMPKYGEAGKKGVVIISTQPEKVASAIRDVTVVGHNLNRTLTTLEEFANQLKNKPDITVVGHQIKKTDSTVVGYDDYKAVFTKVQEPASFPGGIDGWRRYLERNLQYPVKAQEKGTQGVVQVQMIVDTDGNITEMKVVKEPGDGLGEEAMRVLRKGPKWIPAKQNGRLVTYRFIQTLTFQLQ